MQKQVHYFQNFMTVAFTVCFIITILTFIFDWTN